MTHLAGATDGFASLGSYPVGELRHFLLAMITKSAPIPGSNPSQLLLTAHASLQPSCAISSFFKRPTPFPMSEHT